MADVMHQGRGGGNFRGGRGGPRGGGNIFSPVYRRYSPELRSKIMIKLFINSIYKVLCILKDHPSIISTNSKITFKVKINGNFFYKSFLDLVHYLVKCCLLGLLKIIKFRSGQVK